MIHKRPFVEDDLCGVACKHARHMEDVDQHASITSPDNTHQEPPTSGEDIFVTCEDLGGPSIGSFGEVSIGTNKDYGTEASGCFPHFLWVNNGILEADNLSLFPEFFDHGHQLKAFIQPDEILSPLDYPYQKPVSVGPEHQADIPEWNSPHLCASSSQLNKCASEGACSHSSIQDIVDNVGCEEKLMGACVIPMPEGEVMANSYCEGMRDDCGCPDKGSIRCVRQHVVEARQKLRDNLGEETFEMLGFCDMGEGVARKWTEEEENLFNVIVLSNPASIGKNFWDYLSAAFPSRTKHELVSYYFNVFILRKRAEQNRFDPLNIDSDNDEWQRNEDGMVEEDEDSVVESMSGQDASAYYHEDHAEDEDIDDEDINVSKYGSDDAVLRVATDEEYEGDVDDVSEPNIGLSSGVCGDGTGFKLSGGNPGKNGDDYDVQDDSCTSYEYQRDNVDFNMGVDGRNSSQD